MKKLFILTAAVLLISISQNAKAQITLSVGDVALVGINSANPDKFSIVLLKNITANTVINFTDNGFTGNNLTGRTGEGFLTYTAPSSQTAGTILSWTNGASNGSAWSSNNPSNFSFNASGDQLFIFQGNTGNWASQSGITLLFGINYGTALSGTSSAANTLQPNTSILPATAWINLPSATNANGYFANGSSSTSLVTVSGTSSALLAFIVNTGKWFGNSGSAATFPTWNITVCTFPTSVAASSNTPVCSGSTLSLAASATGATSYSWGGPDSFSSSSQNPIRTNVSTTHSGTYTLTATNSCGSVVATTSVTVNTLPTATITAGGPTTFCAGGAVTLTATSGMSSYLWSNGATTQAINVTSSGNYSVTVANANGCTASSASKNVTVNTLPAATITAGGPTIFCTGSAVTLTATSGMSSYLWSNGATTQAINATTSGNYSVTVTNASGCSATSAVTNVTVKNNSTSSSAQTACNSYLWNATTYTASGTYTAHLTNSNGCDSTATLNLIIKHTTTSNTTQTACNSYLWNATTYTASGTYTYTTQNAAGCDSVATLNLTINHGTTSNTTQTACNSYLWNATTYTVSGTYTYTTQNAAGCDSVATLNLTINHGTTSNTSQTACNSYLWNATTYTVSGTYTYTTQNAAGCDSVATLNLTINHGTTSNTPQTACNSYLWNATTYTVSGTYTYTTQNAAGCDSVATLNLTINHGTTSNTTQTACNSYLWNATTYTASGTYTYTTQNAAGCDSVATLNLTINHSTTSNTTQTACNSYLWNATTYTVSGTYTYTTQNVAGCDSVATLVLTINPPPAQPGAFTAKTTFVYQGQTGVTYTVPDNAGATYSWSFSGMGATLNGSSNSVTIDYSPTATSGTLSVTSNNSCGTSAARTLAIALNTPITVPTTHYDYSFVTLGCNRVDYLDTTFSTGDPDYSCGASTANVYQLKRVFTEISHLNPLPKFLIMTGDIVMGYLTPSTPDTTALAKQLTAWKAIYESHPLSSMGITLIAIPGNHETQDKAAGKHSFVSAEKIFTRIMAPYIHGSNGPGIGGPDGLTTDQSKLTYSFNYGGDHYIIIDTDPVGKDGIAPYKWIAGDIQTARANHARHIFAFGHKPAYSSPYTPQGGLDAASTLAQRDSLWKYLENNNCEAMFSAHEHVWDSIHPHTGKTWQVINGDGGTRVEVPWVGPGKQYYGYTLVNLYTDRKVNVMGLGRNTAMSPTVGTSYPINEDSNPTTVRNNFNICLTTTSSTNSTACSSYTWNGTTYTSSGTYTYTTTNAAGCDSVATLNLTITPAVTPAVNIAANPSTTLCAGASVTFTATPTNGGTPTYQWAKNGIPVGTHSATYTDAALSDNDSIVCTMTSSVSCVTASTVVSPVLIMKVNSSAAQPAAFIASSASVNAGQSGVTYTVPDDATVTYSWNYSGTGASINGSGNSVTIDFSSSAISGTLSVTATNSCGTSAARTMSVTVVPATVFTSGRLVVVQTAGAASKGGSGVTLKEYTTSGTAGVSVAIPATGTTPLQMAAGPGGSEGFLTRSTDGTSLILAGFSTSATGIADITITSASSTPRVIFKVDALGNYTQVGSSSTFYSGNDIRGAISDGTNYWASGASNATDGINYYGPGAPTALGTGAKAYGLQIFNGQIYYSTQKTSAFNSTFGIFSLGSGLPTSGTVTPVQIINTGTAIPEDFSFNPAGDVCYIAINLNTSVGGIQKWTKSGSVWSLAYTLGTGVSNIGAYSLVVDYSGLNPVLYATTFESNTDGNRIIRITDTGSGSTAITLATAAANTWFHGIAFSPSCPIPAQPAAFTASAAMVTQGQTGVTYSVPNDPSVTYSWSYSGSGATIHGTGNSVTIDFSSTATGGTLIVTAANACGISAARSMAVTIGGNIRITEYMYNGAGAGSIGEFVELTNLGGTSVDMTGWSFDDNSRTPGSQSLSAFGTVQPGESVILTDNTVSAFRSAWGLCSGIKIIGGNVNNLGREDEINIYDATSTLKDRLTYGDQTFAPGTIRTNTKSGWVNSAGLGTNTIGNWTLSAAGDAEGSIVSSVGDIGSPGKSTHATVSFDPCIIVNGAPTIVMDVINTTNYLDGGVGVSPVSPYGISGVISDPTDPASTLGIDFTINDAETAAGSLTVTATSSNTAVVPIANLNLTGSGASRNIKIIPATVGYSNITVTVSDGTSATAYVINYAASEASANPASTIWHTGMSDASDAIAIDDNYYISGDDELNVLNVYSRSASGLPLKSYEYTSSLNLPDPSKPEVDLEAATRSASDSNKIYWLGSMSNGKAPFDNKPNRNRLFATTISGTGANTAFTFAGYYGNLRASLLTWGDANGYNFTASAAAGIDSKAINGFAAEGMVFGPDNTTLYIGMRAPLVPTANRTKAVIAPILNFETWFNNGAPSGNPTFGSPIELNLGNRGIRELIRLSNGTYLILAGNYAGDPVMGAIYKWTGNAANAPVLVNSPSSASLAMEGAMQVKVAGQLSLNNLQVISDGGDEILYNDGGEAKDLSDLNLRKFRSDKLSALDLNLCHNTTSSTTQTACNSYLWNATTYTASGTYTFTTQNAGGCDSIATLNLTINPLPSVVANASATTVCAGTSVTLTGSGASTYSWTGGVSNGVGFIPATTTTYTVTGTDAHGCANTAIKAITVNPLPSQPGAFTASSSSVNCGQNGVTYTVPNDSSVTYLWSYSGAGATIHGSGNSVTVDFALSATNGILSVIATNGCNSVARTIAISMGITGPSSSQSPYLLPVVPTATFTAILSTPDVVGGYKMCGTPDGLGAFDNGNGTFTLLMNHEFTSGAGVVRAHGSKGAFVSKWIINKSNLSVVSGSDLMQNVKLWNGTGYNTYNAGNPSPLAAFSRFCSADLPPVAAFYNSATGLGTQERIFMNGEENNDESRALAHIVTGPNAGTSYELPYLGKAAWENSVASPNTGDKTVVGLMNDGTDGQVYFYIGTKTNTGTEIDKAGLNGGHPFGVKITGFAKERVNASTLNPLPAPGTHFDLIDLGSVQNMTGAAFNTASNTAGVTSFSRPEDGAWDPSHPNDFYFNTTDQLDQVADGVGSQIGRTRVWRLRFSDITHPELGGTIEAVVDGTEGVNMLDNMAIDNSGHILLLEDVGNSTHNGKVWQYTIATDVLTMVGKHDPTRFGDIGVPATAPFNQDEETSGIIDVQNILGPGMFLLVDQAHYPIAGEAVEGGQLLAYYNPDSYSSNPEVNVQGNNLNIVDGDITPSITDNTYYSSLSIGHTAAKPFVIQNTGVGTLNVSGVNFTGTNASEFTLVSPPAFPLSIAPSSSYTVLVQFAPLAAGTRTATININNNDLDESIYDFTLSGVSTDQPTGPSSSQSPYLLPVVPTATFTAILSTPDVVGGYKMCGTPDGLGAFDNGNGTFTLLMNHEFTSGAGVVRAHGSKGAFVSKWIINKSDLSVVSGSDLMQNVKLWNGTGYNTYNAGNPSPLAAFSRFCSADLPPVSAFYNSATGLGTQERIFMNGEENNDESRALAHIVTGPNAGTSYELPYLGKAAWENSVASPHTGDKTVVGLLNDGTDGQVYFYIGAKTNTGNEIDKAGLNGGHPFGVKVTGFSKERVNASTLNPLPAPGTHFDLIDLGSVANMTGVAFNTSSNIAGVTSFSRPEDGAWDPSHPNDFYFNTTDQLDQVADGVGSQVGRTRVWRLRFDNVSNPELGGSVEAVIDGTEGVNMLDNMAIDNSGHILLLEDVGNSAHNGKVWQYTIATDGLKMVGKHDPTRFGDIGVPATAPFNQDEETSGIIDVQNILGQGMFLLVDQAHYPIAGEAVEGGQLLAYFNPDTYAALPNAYAVTGGGSYCAGSTTSVPVGLSGSQSGVKYQLILNDTMNVGVPIAGTGSSVAFGNQTAAGVFTVLATDTVTNRIAVMMGSASIVVNPLPVATITASGPTAFCAGDSVIFTATSGMNSYLWSNGATTQAITVKATGNYSVTVTNNNGCSAASTVSSVHVSTLAADINYDGIVNNQDLLLELAKFNQSCVGCREDINSDGLVDNRDFLVLLGQFNQSCTGTMQKQ